MQLGGVDEGLLKAGIEGGHFHNGPLRRLARGAGSIAITVLRGPG
jgi:hypothetical protein